MRKDLTQTKTWTYLYEEAIFINTAATVECDIAFKTSLLNFLLNLPMTLPPYIDLIPLFAVPIPFGLNFWSHLPTNLPAYNI